MKKSAVAGIAGAARIDQLSMAELTHAERHGKRLDETGKSRAINDEPPVTTTGLELNELFRAHVEGAFVPKARAKAMQLIIQFPKGLVDGDDADLMLHHARAFAEKVFGPDAIFADRVDRDEEGRHLVDLFLAPKYLKKTKHDEKVAVTMSRHQKELAQQYQCPPTPVGTGRALQQALFEYLRDEMGLKGVKRGEPKMIPGPDWRVSEQLRVEELDDQQAALTESLTAAARQMAALDAAEVDGARRATERDNALADRERQVIEREQEVTEIAAAVAEREVAIARHQRELARLIAAAAADRAAAEHHRRDLDDARVAMIASRDQAAAAAVVADQKRRDVETAEAAAIAEREIIAASLLEIDERRRIEVAQLSLLSRATDDRAGLDLRLAGDGFAIGPNGLSEEDRAVKAQGWSGALVTMARSLARALERVRALARDLARREQAAEHKAAELKEREAKLTQDHAAHNARVAAHQLAIADLDLQRKILDERDARATTASASAKKSHEAALATKASADAVLKDHHRWIEIMNVLEAQPRLLEIASDGSLVLDRYAAAASPALAKAFASRPPAWVVSLSIQRLDLADGLQRAEDREREASYAAEQLTAMIEKAGSVLNPTQQEAATQAERAVRQYRPLPDSLER